MLVMPSSEVRRKRSSRRAAPSSMEYSVGTCRWTKSDPDDMDGEVSSAARAVEKQVGRAGEAHGLDGPAGGRTPAYATTAAMMAGRTDGSGAATTGTRSRTRAGTRAGTRNDMDRFDDRLDLDGASFELVCVRRSGVAVYRGDR